MPPIFRDGGTFAPRVDHKQGYHRPVRARCFAFVRSGGLIRRIPPPVWGRSAVRSCRSMSTRKAEARHPAGRFALRCSGNLRPDSEAEAKDAL